MGGSPSLLREVAGRDSGYPQASRPQWWKVPTMGRTRGSKQNLVKETRVTEAMEQLREVVVARVDSYDLKLSDSWMLCVRNL